MKTRTCSALTPLACAFALTFGSGLSVAPVSYAAAPSLRTAMMAATAGAAGTNTHAAHSAYVREQRSDFGRSNRASRVAPLDENGRARFIVILEGEPVASTAGLPNLKNKKRRDMHSSAAQSRVAQLQALQTSFVSSVSSKLGRTISPLLQYQHALNAVVVELTPEEAATVGAQPGVLRVNREQIKELKTYNTHTLIGADTIWAGTSTPGNLASKGEGMVIGEIDSGINWKSKSFQATGDDGFTVTNPLGAGVYLGNCLANGTTNNGYTSKGTDLNHCNNKLIGIYNTEYSGATYNPASGQDLDGHGSHTASTAGGNAVNGASYAGGTFNISGVAPHANIVAYLACGTLSYSCADTGLAAAYDQAVADGIVDAINYSIGGPEDSPWGSTIQLAALNAADAGIFVAQAAGNDGPGAGSINGNESPWTTTVAASSPAKIPSFQFGLVSVNGSTSVPANTQGLAAIPGSTPAPTQAYTNLPLIRSPNFSDGSNDGCSAYAANTFSRSGIGGIAVLHLDQNASNCGSITRRTNAANAGAVAVIYVDEDFISLGASGASYSVLMSAWQNIQNTPGIDLSTAGNATATLGYPISANSRTPDLVTVYSSRGPIPIAALKPDITAPGDNVLASLSPTTVAGYSATSPNPSTIFGVESGTSMATPHITGSAALVRAIRPDWTPMQVKSALMTTATTAYTTDGGAVADPTVAGAGRVDLTAATRAALLFDETKANFLAADPDAGGDPATLNLASYYHFNCVDVCAFPRTVSSALSVSGHWTIAVSGMPAGSYSLDQTNFSLGAGAQASFTLSVDSKQLAPGQWYYGKLTLTADDSSLPVQRLPIAVRAATAALRASPASLATHAAVGQKVTQNLTVSNAGNPTLNWSIPTTTLKATLLNRPFNTTTGLPDRTIVTSANSTQLTSTSVNDYYGADYFDIYGSGTTLAEVAVHGFGYNSSSGAFPSISTIATQLAVRVWADNGSNQPNGRPGNTVSGDQNPIFQFPSSAGGLGPNAAGVSYPGAAGIDDIIDIDLAAAGASPPGMNTGRYWLNIAPSIVSTSGSGANIASSNYWYLGLYSSASKTPPAQLSIPNNASATNKAWRPINTAALSGSTDYTGYAMKVVVNAACSAPWLSYDSTSGSLGLNGSTPVQVTFNATGLATGTYKAYVCVSGNGTSPANDFTSDEDAILIPVTFTVVTPPASPTCSAAPNPAGGSQTVTISCSGATAGTTNSIPGTTCSPNPTSDGSFTCTGVGSAIGNNPVLTTSTAQGDSAYVTVPLTIDTTPPPTPTCTASPASAVSGVSVTVTCTGVGAGTTNSFPSVSCTPNPADASGTVTCTGNSEAFGTNPVLTSTNTLGNSSQANTNFTLLAQYTVTATAGTGGSIAPPSQIVASGATASFTITPDDHYRVQTVTSTCGGSQSGNTFTTDPVSADCTVNITFVLVTYQVTASAGPNGSITPASQFVNYGDTASFTVTPSAGYLATVSGDTCTVTRIGTSTTWTSSTITADCAVTATFATDYVALNPARLMDTRVGAGNTTVDGVSQGAGPIASHDTVKLLVAGRGGVPASGIVAVALNVTAVTPTRVGYLTVWSGDGAAPNAANLNLNPSYTIPNLVISQVDSNGQVAIFNGGLAEQDVVVDVQGYFPTGTSYVPMTPQRYLDTRSGSTTFDGLFQGTGALASGTQIDVDIAGRNVPAVGVGAAVLNVAAVQPTRGGFVTVWPFGQTQPNASNLNLNPGLTVPNLVISGLGSGKTSLYNGGLAATDLIADIQGWFPSSSSYTTLTPARLLDTRSGGSTVDGTYAGGGAVASNTSLDLQVTGRGSVPADGVAAVVLNVTAVQPTRAGFLTIWPTGATLPGVSNLNLNPGKTIPNLVIAKVGTGGKVSIYNFTGGGVPTDVIVDVQGWFPGEP